MSFGRFSDENQARYARADAAPRWGDFISLTNVNSTEMRGE